MRIEQSSLGSKLFSRALLWGLVFIAVSSAVSLTVQTVMQRNRLAEAMSQIERTNVPAITSALWTVDIELLRTQLDGLVRDELIAHAHVSEIDGIEISAGELPVRSAAVREFDLAMATNAMQRVIGTLTVHGDPNTVLSDVLEYGLIGSIYPALAFIVVGFILNRTFFRLIVARIIDVNEYVRALDPTEPSEPLRLNGRIPADPPEDELEAVAAVINQMRDSIYRQHQELRGAHELAEREVEQRTAELRLTNETLEKQIYQLEQTQARLREADKSRTMFLANMSHEIRTPITGITGLASLLAQTELDDAQREYVGSIMTSAQSLLGIVDDLLDISKLDAGRIDIVEETVEIRPLLESVVSLLAPTAARGNTEVSLHVEPAVPSRIRTDSIRLQQILRNLLGNALKYTPDGDVTIRADLVDSDTLRIAVSDTGIGIPPHALSRLFETFYQADSSYRKKYAGSGLGLSISKRLVEMMGGSIHAESVEGEGSTFSFTIPLRLASEAPAESPSPPPRAAGEPDGREQRLPTTKRLLVAEDNAINRMYLEQFLKNEGHEVNGARNGNEAIQKFEQGDFDLILMDIQMPELDGLEAAKKIRESSDIPIIALTAYARAPETEGFLAAGMNAVVTKPIDERRLRKVIEEIAG
jgi:signal transduction histidine kinase